MKAGLGAGCRAIVLALCALALVAAAGPLAAGAQAARGGVSAVIPEPIPEPVPAQPPTATGSRVSALLGGHAQAPLAAPPAVKQVIAAANRIRKTPYVWGGGHRSWSSRGYDCSGAVSYALHGGGLLDSPLVSGSFMSWGAPGPGRWITIYAHGSHVYAVIAGLRWDTSGNVRGTGPRWHKAPASPKGFVVRHPVGY